MESITISHVSLGTFDGKCHAWHSSLISCAKCVALPASGCSTPTLAGDLQLLCRSEISRSREIRQLKPRERQCQACRRWELCRIVCPSPRAGFLEAEAFSALSVQTEMQDRRCRLAAR